MRVFFIFCTLLCFSTFKAFTQATFVKYLSTSLSSTGCTGRGLAEKANGDFIVQFRFGDKTSNGTDFGYFFLNKFGDSLGTKAYHLEGEDYTKHVVIVDENHIATSGTFLPVGRSYYDLLFYEIDLLDSSKNRYHYYDNFYGHYQGEVLLRKNKSFYLLNSRTVPSTSIDFNLTRVDLNGMQRVDSTFIAPLADFVLGGTWDNDSNILITGGSFSGSTDQTRVLAMKVDTNGQEQWRTFVGIDGDSTFFCRSSAGGIVHAHNGNYYLGGSTNNWCDQDPNERVIGKPLIICLDRNGNHLWTKKVNLEPQKSHFFGETFYTQDEKLVFIGGVDLPTGTQFVDNLQVLIVKYDLNGNLIWKRIIGKDDYNEIYYEAIQTRDGGYLITGRYENIQNPTNNVRTFVMKLDACGCLVPGCDPNCNATGIEHSSANHAIEVYPNPNQGKLEIKTEQVIQEYTIYSTLGALQQRGYYNGQAIELNDLPSGMYLIQFKLQDGQFIQKEFVRE